MSKLDARLNAFRPDLADAALQGSVDSPRFSQGELAVVRTSEAPVRRSPSSEAQLDTEALAGERVRVFDTTDEGWAWCQLERDHYVGWMPRDCLRPPLAPPTHKVSALRTLVFRGPDIKQPPLHSLPLGALVTVTGHARDQNAEYALIEPAGAIVVQHLSELAAFETDPVEVAARFLGTPYLWGGKTSLGIDCSGLVQVALQACGIEAPRDSDMQEAALGELVPFGETPSGLRRGDLLFWDGHVGIMEDAETLLHGNAYHMAVAREPLTGTLRRYSARGVPLTSVRRIGGAP